MSVAEFEPGPLQKRDALSALSSAEKAASHIPLHRVIATFTTRRRNSPRWGSLSGRGRSPRRFRL